MPDVPPQSAPRSRGPPGSTPYVKPEATEDRVDRFQASCAQRLPAAARPGPLTYAVMGLAHAVAELYVLATTDERARMRAHLRVILTHLALGATALDEPLRTYVRTPTWPDRLPAASERRPEPIAVGLLVYSARAAGAVHRLLARDPLAPCALQESWAGLWEGACSFAWVLATRETSGWDLRRERALDALLTPAPDLPLRAHDACPTTEETAAPVGFKPPPHAHE